MQFAHPTYQQNQIFSSQWENKQYMHDKYLLFHESTVTVYDWHKIHDRALFVFSTVGPRQNAGSLLTPVSYTGFYALSYGTLGFALHGSSFNHCLIGGDSSTANQIL